VSRAWWKPERPPTSGEGRIAGQPPTPRRGRRPQIGRVPQPVDRGHKDRRLGEPRSGPLRLHLAPGAESMALAECVPRDSRDFFSDLHPPHPSPRHPRNPQRNRGLPTLPGIPGPYRVCFHSSDCGEPPHIHVERDDATCKAWLYSLSFAWSKGFASHELSRIRRLIGDHQTSIVRAWNAYCH
jgi:hypothetical protein